MKTKTIEGWVPDGEIEQDVLGTAISELEYWGVCCRTKADCSGICCPDERPRKTEITITVNHKD